MAADSVKDFFISYNKADLAWAEWIAWTLEGAGMTTHLQAWDFRPGANFVLAMHEALQMCERTIIVLSPSYLAYAPYSAAEWAATFVQDPTGIKKILLPVRVHDCEPRGLLATVVYIDIIGCDEVSAAGKLLAGIDSERAKPATAPGYPGEPTSSAGPDYPAAWPAVWTVPHAHNPFFSGREVLLQHLHERLTSTKATALTQAISGLGGIGKTQTAIEYAYRYGYAYRYVLWMSAATSEALLNDCAEIARRLHISAFDPQDQRTLVPALQQWLTQQRHWLLILDNADDLTLVRTFLPARPHIDGHILLTTRAQATGALAQSVAVEKMDDDEGMLLLLRRASLIAPNELPAQTTAEMRNDAQAIVRLLDGLPLALDQAGGYIEESGCSLQDYLHLYQEHRRELLNWKSQLSPTYPATVATTWSLAFQRIEQANPAAAALLQFCAFLAPDAIAESVITEVSVDSTDIIAPIIANAFERNAAFELLRRYSLLRRNAATKTLSIHRLVQVVLQDTMPIEIQHMWAERVINTIQHIFTRIAISPALDPYVPHAYICLGMSERYGLITPTCTQLLHVTGNYLLQYARYDEAETFYHKALAMLKQLHGSKHLAIAPLLNEMGLLYYYQDRYQEAEHYYRQALELYTTLQGDADMIAGLWYALGRLYHRQGRYQQAEDAYNEALPYYTSESAKDEKYDIAVVLHELATLYEEQGKYLQAEDVFKLVKSATAIQPTLVADDTTMQAILNVIVDHYRANDEYGKVEALYQEMLAASEQQLGAEHPTTAAILHAFGWHKRGQGNYDEANVLYQRALGIREKVLGIEHTSTAQTLYYLAELRRQQGQDEETEKLLLRAFAIYEKVLGTENISTGVALHELARLYEAQDKYEKAELFYQRALNIYKKVQGAEHSDIALILNELARVYKEQGNYDDAMLHYKRALEINEKSLGDEHPNTVAALHQLALLYQKQEKYDIAESFYIRTVNASEKVSGIEHLSTIRAIKDYATLLRIMGRESEAVEVEAHIAGA